MGAKVRVSDSEEFCEADNVEVGSEEIDMLADEKLIDEDDTSLGVGKGVPDDDGIGLGIGVEVGP